MLITIRVRARKRTSHENNLPGTGRRADVHNDTQLERGALVITHYLHPTAVGFICGQPAMGDNRVSADLSKVDCASCIHTVEELVARFSTDPWVEKIGMFCICKIREAWVDFKYMARLHSVDSAGKLHFVAKDGTPKVLDRSAIIEVESRQYVGLPPDQTRLPRFL